MIGGGLCVTGVGSQEDVGNGLDIYSLSGC